MGAPSKTLTRRRRRKAWAEPPCGGPRWWTWIRATTTTTSPNSTQWKWQSDSQPVQSQEPKQYSTCPAPLTFTFLIYRRCLEPNCAPRRGAAPVAGKWLPRVSSLRALQPPWWWAGVKAAEQPLSLQLHFFSTTTKQTDKKWKMVASTSKASCCLFLLKRIKYNIIIDSFMSNIKQLADRTKYDLHELWLLSES